MTVPLNYAPAKRNWRKRIVRIVLAMILLGVTICIWRWGPYAWHQSQILYWQNRCMNYSASPEMVVYEEDPVNAAELLPHSGYFPQVLRRLSGPDDTNPKPTTIAKYIPACWRNWKPFPGTITVFYNYSPPRWINRPNAIMFLHELVSPAGHRRFVCLYYVPEEYGFTPLFVTELDCETYLAKPASWGKPAMPVGKTYGYSIPGGWPVQPPKVRIYAGQPDPKNPSRFTVRYQMWGQEDVLDGQLLDDDGVTLKARHMPSEPRQ